MKALKRIGKLLNRTGAIKFFFAYLIILFISGIILSLIEPQVHGIFEGFYFCFVASTTIGFGDITAVSIIGRILSVILGVYGLIVVALITSIIINFYSETKYIKMSGSIDDPDNNEPVTVPDEEPVTVTDEEARRERRRKLRDDLRRRREKREGEKSSSRKAVKVRKKEASEEIEETEGAQSST